MITEIKVPLESGMLPVAVGFAEQTAKALGFGREEQLYLSLAVEEVFSYLASQGQEGEALELTCRHGGYYIEAVCCFSRGLLPTKVFNATSELSLEDEGSLAELGLLLAARTVDRFHLVMEKGGRMVLRLTVDKRYPEAEQEAMISLPPGDYRLHRPLPEDIKEFARNVLHFYPDQAPDFCRFPGKLVDMIGSGEYGMVLAKENKGHIGGGFLWRYNGNMAECYGPYVFAAKELLIPLLVEGAIAELARTEVLCMVLRQPAGPVSEGYFEILGEFWLVEEDGAPVRQQALYRQMEEDNGMTVFIHPQMETFVRQCYDRLALPRQLRSAVYEGEGRSADSLLSSRLNRLQSMATLSLLVVGDDILDNLKGHVKALRKEGIKNICFELDMGKGEGVQLVPELLAAGFVPQLVVPWGAPCGDAAVFMHAGGE